MSATLSNPEIALFVLYYTGLAVASYLYGVRKGARAVVNHLEETHVE